MPSFSLASYTLRIRDVEERDWEYLDDFGTRNLDLYDILAEYLHALGTEISFDNDNKRLIKLRPPLHMADRILSGILETGEWGYTSQLQDVTSRAITHNRRVEESENFPFYFLISVPQFSQRGVVILQRFGNSGIRTQLLTDFQNHFSTIYDELRVHINPLAPGTVIDQYLSRDGRVTQIRLIQFNAPDDIATLFRSREEAIKDVYTEYIIHARANKRIPIFDRMRAVLEGRRQASNLVEIEGVEPQVVKLNIDFNGKQRTIDIGNVNEMRAYYDITEAITTGADGHPEFESIDQIARELLDELNQLLGQGE